VVASIAVDIGVGTGLASASCGARSGRVVSEVRDGTCKATFTALAALAERPDVGAPVDVAPRHHLLRAHVLRRAEHRPGLGGVIGVLDLGDAEVEHLDDAPVVAPIGEEQVRGLEVAVDDAERMRLGDRVGSLDHALHRLLDAEQENLVDGNRIREARRQIARPREALFVG
jgi:hypothetical protein